MKKFIKIVSLVLLFLVIASFAFYWYSYRPSQIRESCNNDAFLESMGSKYADIEHQKERLDLKDSLYTDCLRYNGIEK